MIPLSNLDRVVALKMNCAGGGGTTVTKGGGGTGTGGGGKTKTPQPPQPGSKCQLISLWILKKKSITIILVDE